MDPFDRIKNLMLSQKVAHPLSRARSGMTIKRIRPRFTRPSNIIKSD
jgi:hypothetical protein